MAINIPIITEFNGKGIDKAKKEFAQLETVGQKAAFAIRKAAIPAGIAIAAIGAAGKTALAAGEEVNSANNRVRQINKSMGLFGKETDVVTKRLIKLAEAQARELGISNLTVKATQAKLLTFKNLAQSANTVGGAFDRANKAALDLAAAGFGSAEGNAVQLGKALEDPIKGLAALARSGINFTEQEKEKIKTLVESNKMLEAQELVLAAIEKQVGGTAEATADDTKRMKEAFDQVKQSIGLGLLPILEKVTPQFMKFADFARENEGVIIKLAGAIGAVAGATLAANAAMAINPYVLAASGIVAMALAFDRLYASVTKINKLGGLAARVLGVVFGGPAGAISSLLKISDAIYGAILPSSAKTGAGVGGLRGDLMKELKGIPGLANGGIVKASPGGTLALIGEGGKDEAVIPLDRMGSMGGNNITINVQGADPNAVVDALRTYMFRNGSVPIRVS
jgi:hypothetical protein